MYPTTPTRYPEFVADQILTAQNLQDLFNYLDEQERLTRTNLIGLGIVCGLEAYTHTSGNSINISKGVGVTSAGYLVAVPAAQYTYYSSYNAENETFYDRFVDPASKKQRFPLWQLAKAGTPQAEKPLDKSFLSDKVILVFVELLKTGNKNCDPDSCDDKGITIDVAFKFLLVEEKNVGGLIGIKSESSFFNPGPKCMSWPELKMPRYNVPASTLPDAASIFKSYLSILSESFLGEVETVLTKAYAGTQLLVANDLPGNPFSNLKEKMAFLYDGSINLNQLIMVQYYYDFISDLLQGYEELRSICNKYLAICCPDAGLFPRHLLLYAAFPSKEIYRHRFMPSPALNAGDGLVGEMRFLMRRLSAMVQMVQIPPQMPHSLAKRKAAEVRITPSKLGDVALSQKAIPYYYDALDSPALYNQWNYQKTNMGKGATNFGYYAPEYNVSDDYVRHPLKYDLEPYNFLRIEGHIGKPWQTAFQEIYQLKYKYRLPFEVVALNGDFKSLLAFVQQSIADLGKVLAEHPEQWRKILCYFTDIEMQYDMQAAELRCTIGKVMRYFYSLTADQSAAKAGKPVSALLAKFDPAYLTKAATYGAAFDEWYPTVKDQAYIAPAQMLAMATVNMAAGKFISPVAIMYYLEKIHELLPDGIVQVNLIALQVCLRDAIIVAEAMLKALKNLANTTDNKAGDDAEAYLQLNAVIRICKGSLLIELYRNFIFRFYLFLANQSFAMYSFLNSGIQHKAGVPMGGTFVMVYHDALPERNLAVAADIKRDNATVKTRAAVPEANAVGDGITMKRLATENETVINRIKQNAETLSRLDTSEKMFAIKNDLSKVSSVKDAGMFYLAEVVAARAAEDELSDKELLEMVAEIPDGTVIADFYLPYICASECMPMSFVVLGQKEDTPTPVKPTIESKIKEACVADKTAYELILTPALSDGGLVSGEGVNITGGQAFFNPSAVNVGTALQKEVVITYTIGAEKAEIKIVVFAQPKASFQAASVSATALGISLSNVIAVGASFSWRIADKEVSTIANPQMLTVDKPGSYLVTLLVSNGPCNAASFEQLVQVAVTPPPPVNTCMPLQKWADAYAKWNQTNNRVFVMFVRLFGSYGKVNALFTQQLPAVMAAPTANQVKMLSSIAPPNQVIEWMQELQKLILELQAQRSIALELFRILEGLLMFYACMQKEDIGAANVPTEAAFKMDAELVSAWQQIVANFLGTDKEVVLQKLKDIQGELENVKATAPDKKDYAAFLNRLAKILSTMVA